MTRAMSHQTEEVEWAGHIAWLQRVIENPDRKLYIAEVDGQAVGTVRADTVDGITELSWTVAPSWRGKGFGKAMVKLAAASISQPIRCEIKKYNTPSERIAKFSGMTFDRIEGDVLHYRRPVMTVSPP